MTSNKEWGDAWVYRQPHNSFCVLLKNVNMLNQQSMEMLAIMTELNDTNSSIFLAQEMNTAWKPAALQMIQTQCNRVFHNNKLATSSSTDSTENTFQPGGTLLTLALGKWVSRVISSGTDAPLG